MSDGSETTGVSPELKRYAVSLGSSMGSSLTMPSDEATELEWNRTIFTKLNEMCGQIEALKESLEFSN